ncbi:MAG: sirohydrochlorin cobaltochelatase [Zhenhengia sp.]|jgi:sirohydrochlorin cobaltochelatase|uniref:sirohydrochlorin cobaltochelatase n=1 Tax=Zhenhengia sp. TaxID=2944208 RepID=UPI00290FD8F5|nr:sirohydrochlorin cobaltochelatase [Clostridiales bacterium]MDU6974769.1 sirohydrochlorin cobaltochelatase [Clostridiales bacterium]
MSKKALLVVSFGTSYEDTRKKTIEPCENLLRKTFKDYDFFRAYTSQMIIRKLASRDGLYIDNAPQALQKIYEAGYDEVLIQSLHIICGEEYDKLKRQIEPFKAKFKKLSFGRPLLTTIDDYKAAVSATLSSLPKLKEHEGVVFMGHGTYHESFSAYCTLEYMFQHLGASIYVGTVEGYPTLDEVLYKLQKDSITQVYLAPFMLVAGDHAINDMAGDEEDSWKIILSQHGIQSKILLQGLGENKEIQKLFVNHALDCVNSF